jgi:hypothetical protein
MHDDPVIDERPDLPTVFDRLGNRIPWRVATAAALTTTPPGIRAPRAGAARRSCTLVSGRGWRPVEACSLAPASHHRDQLIAARELLAGTARPRPRCPRRLARTRAARALRAGVGSAAAARRRGRRTGASASGSSTGRIRRRVTVLSTHRVRRRARCGWVAGSVGRGRAWVSRHSHRRPHHHTGGEP